VGRVEGESAGFIDIETIDQSSRYARASPHLGGSDSNLLLRDLRVLRARILLLEARE
jgi:hypothetical protein